MTVEKRFTFLILLGILDLRRGHARVLHIVGPLHKASQHIIGIMTLKVVLGIESLCRDVVSEHGLSALSGLFIQEHHKMLLLVIVVQGAVAGVIYSAHSCLPI